MIRWAVLALALLAPVQAAALSCAPYFVQNAYTEAAESPDPYVVVEGELSFDTSKLPKTDWTKQDQTPPRTKIKARLKGYSLAQDGFTEPFRANLTLIVACAGPWCPRPQPGLALAFLKRTDVGYELLQGACGGFLFSDPDFQMIRTVETCFAGGDCTPPEY